MLRLARNWHSIYGGCRINRNGIGHFIDLIFPNPASDLVILQMESDTAFGFDIYTRQGQWMQGKRFENGTQLIQIDLSGLSEGVYFNAVRDEYEGVIGSERVIKMLS